MYAPELAREGGTTVPRSTRPGARAADLPRGAAWPGVLAVDDDAAVLGLLSVGLALQGFSVWQASSGAEAIAIYSAHRADIHVVLLDVDMPGLDGPQTLTALRALDPDLPAGFMTGNSSVWNPDWGRLYPVEREATAEAVGRMTLN